MDTPERSRSGDITRVTRPLVSDAWAGSREHLAALFSVVGDLVAELERDDREKQLTAPNNALREAEEELRVATEELGAEPPSHPPVDRVESAEEAARRRRDHLDWSHAVERVQTREVWLRRAQDEARRVEKQLAADWSASLELNSKSGSVTYAGNARDLANAFDTRERQTFTLTAPEGWGKSGKISLRATENAIFLNVTGTSEGWLNGAFAALERELNRSVPWWKFLRSAYVPTILFVVTSAIMLFLIAAPSMPTDLDAAVSVGVWLGGMSLLLGWIGGQVTTRVIPAFEVHEAGQRARGAAAMAVLGTALLSVLIGIVVNQIS